jgi:hypothetical protein
MTQLVILESELMPFFDSGQRKILRSLSQSTANQIQSTINDLALDDLSDVIAPSPVTGDVLTFDGTDWVNDTIPAPVVELALDDLTDVVITTAASGDILAYDSVEDEWINQENSIENLTDVTVTSAVEYQTLQLVDGVWVNRTPYSDLSVVNGTTYDLEAGDDGTFIVTTESDPVTLEIQNDTAWATAPNSPQIEIAQYGTGAVTVTAASGVTLRYSAALTNVLNGQYATAGLKRIGTNEWLLFGNLTPA